MKEFFILLLVLETAMIGVFIALDLFLFYFFWEATLIPMALIIGIFGHERRVYAAVKFFLYTMIASVFMLAAIIWLYAQSGTFDFAELQHLLASGAIALPGRTALWLFLGFFVAFAVKVPLFPLHTWLPDAHVEAPTAGSVLLAGVLLKMGTYGLLRFNIGLFPAEARRNAPWIITLAIIGIVYGALVALVQPNMKKLVAYSSVSHLGFVVLGIYSFTRAGMDGAVFQMLNHGISTGALFLLLGMVYDRRHTYEIKEYGGLATPMPVYATLFLLITLASIGLAADERIRRRVPDPQRSLPGQGNLRNPRRQRRHLERLLHALALPAHLLRNHHATRSTPRCLMSIGASAACCGRSPSLALVMGVFPSLWMNSIDASVASILEKQPGVYSAPTLQVKVNTVLK